MRGSKAKTAVWNIPLKDINPSDYVDFAKRTPLAVTSRLEIEELSVFATLLDQFEV